ncbi:hypothetical protein EKO04_009318 [Ascochyta lentis]|uniref:Uncharacterized protein n=1 Tax=Ascochyta lentis TaxID=205686 RepID=A0A8H7IX25_9PLEO|nr:hypothetical protein EKO04_009318 [Ascochyta lentis]
MAEESGLVDRHQEEEAETRSSTSSLSFASDTPDVDGVGTLFTDLSDDDEEGYNGEIEISGDDSWKVEPYAPHVVGSERKTPPPTPRLPSTQKLPWLPKSKHDELQRYKTDAVIKLLGILIEDADCAKLFWLAVTDGSIERENLEVRVRSMIITLAADLAEEADKHTERIMPSFASENAETFAWALIELAQAAPKIPEPYHSETKKEKDNNDAAHTKSL